MRRHPHYAEGTLGHAVENLGVGDSLTTSASDWDALAQIQAALHQYDGRRIALEDRGTCIRVSGLLQLYDRTWGPCQPSGPPRSHSTQSQGRPRALRALGRFLPASPSLGARAFRESDIISCGCSSQPARDDTALQVAPRQLARRPQVHQDERACR
jgi:hypothetical protein